MLVKMEEAKISSLTLPVSFSPDCSSDEQQSHLSTLTVAEENQTSVSHGFSPEKRGRNNQTWKVNVRKDCRNSGKQYVSRRGRVIKIKKKSFNESYDCMCRMQCAQKVPMSQRKEVFDNFWKLDWNSQEQHIVSSVMQVQVRYRKVDSTTRKNFSRIYHLTNSNQRVCKNMFLRTYGISNRRMDSALRKNPNTNLVSPDQNIFSANKTPSDVTEGIVTHEQIS